jgi:DNA-directed RNA polymerase specialized sigma24 family protein
MNGTELLADFRGSRSEQAFGELVRHYTNLVYSVARRRLANGSLAEEATQMVFIRLACSDPQGFASAVRFRSHGARIRNRRQIHPHRAQVHSSILNL